MSYRLAICLPCRDILHTAFAYDLARLTAYWSAKHVPAGGSLMLFTSQGTLIADQRQNLVLEAINAKSDYILWLDSDMRFPKDLVDQLQSHGEDIVACNYSTRRVPAKPVAFGDERCSTLVYTTPSSTGLESVHAVGMGAMLERTSVYEQLKLPYFTIGYSQHVHDFFGEDVFHCKQARDAGLTVWIDHDASKQIKHIGTFEYAHEHADACREIIEKEAAKDVA